MAALSSSSEQSIQVPLGGIAPVPEIATLTKSAIPRLTLGAQSALLPVLGALITPTAWHDAQTAV